MWRIMSPIPGDSTLMTSAPWSASIIPASGPEIMVERSMTLMPVSGPVLTEELLVPSTAMGVRAQGGVQVPTRWAPRSAVR